MKKVTNESSSVQKYFGSKLRPVNWKEWLMTLFVAILVLVLFGVYQIHKLTIAHSSFENYYKFRGCEQLIEKTATYGMCKIASGETIKIVLIDGKWYLDGDGPRVW